MDSRLLEPGGVFFALPGMKTDGHQFLEQAAQKGAVAAVVQAGYTGPDYGLILARVPDPLKALQSMARKILGQRKVRVVGITGSVGKTTTKEFTAQLLRQKYTVMASPGNSNTQTGLPLNILNHTDGREDILVLEMGMTEAGHIRQLVDIAPPEVAVITTTALVHAQNFSSLEAIGWAKSEIFSHPLTKWGILSRDILNFHELCGVGSCPKFSFSLNDNTADLTAVNRGCSLLLRYQGEEILLPPLSVPGEHNIHNLMAAVAAARYFEVDWHDIIQVVPILDLPERRFQQVMKDGILFVNDSYNASEASVKAAIKSLPPASPGGKRIALLGEMLELGRFSEQCHREVGKYALEHVERMICLGQECRAIYDLWKEQDRTVQWVETVEEAVKILKSWAQPGDVVLLKGSRAKGLWKVLDEV